MIDWLIEHGLTSAPTQYRLYGRRFFYWSKDRTNSIKVLKEKATKKNNTKNKENTKYTCIDTQKSRQIQHTSITQRPLVYNNMGWLGDSSHSQARTAVGLPPRYPHLEASNYPHKTITTKNNTMKPNNHTNRNKATETKAQFRGLLCYPVRKQMQIRPTLKLPKLDWLLANRSITETIHCNLW